MPVARSTPLAHTAAVLAWLAGMAAALGLATALAHENHAPLPTKGVTVAGNNVLLSDKARVAIGLTTAKILGIDHVQGEIKIANIDAFDGTPVLDLKAYIPVCDRVENVRVPEWASDWPEWLPEEGLGLEE